MGKEQKIGTLVEEMFCEKCFVKKLSSLPIYELEIIVILQQNREEQQTNHVTLMLRKVKYQL